MVDTQPTTRILQKLITLAPRYVLYFVLCIVYYNKLKKTQDEIEREFFDCSRGTITELEGIFVCISM